MEKRRLLTAATAAVRASARRGTARLELVEARKAMIHLLVRSSIGPGQGMITVGALVSSMFMGMHEGVAGLRDEAVSRCVKARIAGRLQGKILTLKRRFEHAATRVGKNGRPIRSLRL